VLLLGAVAVAVLAGGAALHLWGTPGSAAESPDSGPARPGASRAASSSAQRARSTQRPSSRRTEPLDLAAHSTTNPASIWVVVNKTHPIRPLDFRPDLSIVRGYQVARPAAGPLTRLLAAGDAAGLGLKIESAFRSFAYQVHVHDQLVTTQGSSTADRVSARPGYSEHQTGLAVDLTTPAHPACDLAQCFARTPAGRWLAQRAWRFGFVVRYTAGNQAVTGYEPEPWHLRYVGRPLAAWMRATGVSTLEQVFHVSGGDYR
jgi:D-alanyl-D-alanine carboxypeptidase